jgi:putative flippase GtrA
MPHHSDKAFARSSPPRSDLTGLGMFGRYGLFAGLAILANLLAQEITLRLMPGAPLSLSILVGTATGFVLKYVLDKKWVFDDGYAGHRQELQKITLNGAFSVLTTLVFWGFEIAFWNVWQTDVAKYTGAVLGLCIGYAAKFVLDRSFVFRGGRA